ncbi:hypothetical protein NA57DRAFT_81014 [Rhizodiscina lignyota]|uniref:Uncharacterized protein n=1 Tax=Rhizodiscina lignyota TaxID=1504668 RepID=A0A9P4I2U2_9PEZI|nr:hypothetical protein NA57DRAFT_81014 [Rhizodiscina lignyota]
MDNRRSLYKFTGQPEWLISIARRQALVPLHSEAALLTRHFAHFKMVKWDAEADAKLFAAFIKVHNVKIDYEALAREMGPDCTAKAIMHRIGKIKGPAGAKGANGKGANGGSPATPRRRAPAASGGSVKRPDKANGIDKVKKEEGFVDVEDVTEDDYDDLPASNVDSSPSIDRSSLRRGTKRSYAESDITDEEDVEDDGSEEDEFHDAEEGDVKRVKREDSNVEAQNQIFSEMGESVC